MVYVCNEQGMEKTTKVIKHLWLRNIEKKKNLYFLQFFLTGIF